MKLCAACHQDLPKDKFSKKQWKLNQRRCKVCVGDNREVQPLPLSPPPNNNNGPANDNESNDGGIDNLLESMSINNHREMIPVSDEDIFKQPPLDEDCPICFIRMPSLWTGYKYMSCCGKITCSGCVYAEKRSNGGKLGLCPFCRTPSSTTDKEIVTRNKKRAGMKDPMAIYSLGCKYDRGSYGCPQDYAKALELWHRAAELGLISAYYNIGNSYLHGTGVQSDMKKAKHYWELAAVLGHVGARHNLGVSEKHKGNMDRAIETLYNFRRVRTQWFSGGNQRVVHERTCNKR